MPELPEVESVRRGLEPHLVGSRVVQARARRPEYVRAGRRSPAALLQGDAIAAVTRLGKHLALQATSGRVVVLHLGMSGQVLVLPASQSLRDITHAHITWTVQPTDGTPRRIVMRDPRRFGGVWTLPDPDALAAHWAGLGPDALHCTAARLRTALAGSRAPVKARLLDQATVAGIGNIYADEALHQAGIHPLTPAGELGPDACRTLAAAVRRVLRAAVRAGGSTLSDFVHPDGTPGTYRLRHAVYGRGGEACRGCGEMLASALVAQRTTVWCPRCQPRG